MMLTLSLRHKHRFTNRTGEQRCAFTNTCRGRLYCKVQILMKTFLHESALEAEILAHPLSIT